jgi:hypothetical protein
MRRSRTRFIELVSPIIIGGILVSCADKRPIDTQQVAAIPNNQQGEDNNQDKWINTTPLSGSNIDTPQEDPIPSNQQGEDNNQNKWINITPLSSLKREKGFGRYPKNIYSDTYTRLKVTSKIAPPDNDETAKDNKKTKLYEARNPISRFFWGTHNTITFSAKVITGEFNATIPLVTMVHVSNSSDGEGFTRVINHQAQNFPLFLIKGNGSNGIASVQFSVKATDNYQSNAAAVAVQVAQSVTQVLAPQASVLTTLTQQKTKDIAAVLDKTISQQFSKAVAEEQWIDDDIRRWDKGVSATFNAPVNDGSWNGDGIKTVGEWTVSFDNPRPSIFSDVQICQVNQKADSLCETDIPSAINKIQTEILNKPEEILSFQLTSNGQGVGTIAAYLKQQDWWGSALQKFAKNNSPAPDDVAQFCRALKQSIVNLNLNSVDAGIVAVAVQKGAVIPTSVVKAMENDTKNCGLYEIN